MTTGDPGDPAAAKSPRRRPTPELIVVVVFTYVAGFLSIGVGIVFILLRYAGGIGRLGGSFGVTLMGACAILVGLFIIALASALTRGKHYARVLVTVALSVEFVLALVSLIVGGAAPWLEVVVILVAALSVLVLWVGRTGRYFSTIAERDAASRRPGP